MTEPSKTFTDHTMVAGQLGAAPPAAFPMLHFLYLHQENSAPKRIPLETLPLTIGRVAPAELVLADPAVSRRHCQFYAIEGDLFLSDLQSTNGTVVDGQRVTAPLRLSEGATITVGSHTLTYHRRSQREAEETAALDRELHEANSYVLSILPAPLDAGPVTTEWHYLPCTRLGGDAFGYQQLDENHLLGFMLDVSGHGTGAALHAVTVATVLRQRLLPGVDFSDPVAVVRSLNSRFAMEAHNSLMFTIWLGVYAVDKRTLTYCVAGHHAGFLRLPDSQATMPLATRNPAVGFLPDYNYVSAQVPVPAGSALYLFSDGVFEIIDRDGRQWGLDDIIPLLGDGKGTGEALRLYETVRGCARPGPLEDDFSLLIMRFD